MNCELWIDACRLQAIFSQLKAQEDSFTEVANIKEFRTLKQGVTSFIADHAQRGSIPSDPLAVLQAELRTARQIPRLLAEATCPMEHIFLSDEHWWGVQDGFRQVADVAIPDTDFWASAKLEDRLSPQPYIRGLTAIEAGGCHCLAMDQNGTVFGWGEYQWGQTLSSRLTLGEIEATKGFEGIKVVPEAEWDLLFNTPLEDRDPVRKRKLEKIGASGVDEIFDKWPKEYKQIGVIKEEKVGKTVQTGLDFDSVRLRAESLKEKFPDKPASELERVLDNRINIILRDTRTQQKFDFTRRPAEKMVVDKAQYNFLIEILKGADCGEATPAFVNAHSIAAGDWHGVVLKNDGTLAGWGNNDHGQATPPDNLQGIVSIAAGGNHSLTLLDDGTVVGWGNNDHGQITPPDNLHGVAFISAGQEHSLALLENGTVAGWGNNHHGQATPPDNLQGVMAIAAGGDHSLALLNDGTVVGWGGNGEGQTEPPAGLQGVKAIAAGGHHSLALLQNGTVVGWGNNDFGQATPPPLSNVITISAGNSFSVVLKEDGNFYSWGYDIAGDAPPPRGIPRLIPLGPSTQPEHSLACIRGLALTGSGQPGPTNPDEVWTVEEQALAVQGRALANELAGILNGKLQENESTAKADAWLERLSEEVKQTWADAAGGLHGMPLEKITELDEETTRLLGVDGYSREELLRGADIQELKEGAGPIHEQMEQQLQYMDVRLDATRVQSEFRKRQAPKLAGIAFILVNQAMWNFDGISPAEHQLMLEMMEDWDRRLGMRLGHSNIVSLVQWATNKWNEDAQTGTRANYEAIVGSLCRLNRFERPIVSTQLHKLGDLDGGITAEQLQFIHDIETYLNTEGLVAAEDEALMNTDEAACYILLVMALWDDDGFTEEEQGAVAEIMGNFSIGLPQDTLVTMLEEGVQQYNQDSDTDEIVHLENCVDRAISGLDDTWKHWLIDSLRYLAAAGGTTDQQQDDFLVLLSRQLGVKKEPEQAAA